MTEELAERQYHRGEMLCPLCHQNEWTWLRRWYLGHETVWFCDFCYEMIPPVALA
jgi:hypothetical protein